MIAVGDALLVAGGWGLLRLVAGPGPWPFGWVGGAALSLLAGATAIGVATTLLSLAGLPLWPAIVAMLALALAGLRRGRPHWSPATPTAAGGVAAMAGAWLVVTARSGEVVMNDEYAIWALRGRAFAEGTGLGSPVFTDAAAQYQHLDYPLLVPSLVAWAERWAGSLDGAAHMQVALLAAAMLGVVAWAGARLAGSAAAACAVLAAIVPTGAAAYALRIYAEVPTAAFAMATTMLGLVWLREREPVLLRVAAITTAGALLSKNEAGLFALAALLATGLAAGSVRRVGWCAGAALIAYAPWVAWTRVNGLENDVINADTLTPGRLLDNLGRLDDIGAGFANHWPGPGWGLPLLAVAVIAAVGAGQGRLAAATVLTAALALAGLSLSYIATPQDVDRHLATSASRVLLFPAVLTLVAVPLLAGAAAHGRTAPVSSSRPGPAPSAKRA